MTTFPGRVEVALNPDRSASSFSWDWTDLTALVQQPEVSLNGGRPDEGAQPEPGSLTLLLDNGTGNLTPRRPTSVYYPDWEEGVPLRYSAKGGLPHLMCTGNTGCQATSADHASFDIVGDISWAVEFWAPIATPPPGFNYQFGPGKFNNTGNQRSYLPFLASDGTIRFRWSTDGTAAGEKDALSSVPCPRPRAGLHTIGGYLDVSSGGNHVMKFYTCRGSIADLLAALAASQLGADYTGSGVTSIFASTATLGVGDVPGSGFLPYPGEIRHAQLRSGDLSTGTIVWNPDFTTRTPGDTSFTESAGRTVTLGGDAEIMDYQIRLLGEVTSIRPRWPGNGVAGTAQVEVTASGILRRLRQGQDALQSALYRKVTGAQNAANVIAAWPFEDASGSTTAASPIAGVQPMIIGGSVQLASSDFLSSSKPLPSVAGDAVFGWNATIPDPGVTLTNWAVTAFYRIDTPETSPTKTDLMMVDASGDAVFWRIAIDDTNVTIRAEDSAGGFLLSTSSAGSTTFFDTALMVVLGVEQNGANTDWTLTFIPIPSGVATSYAGSFAGTIGRPLKLRNLENAPPDGIAFGWFIVTTDAEIGWLAPADTGFLGETAAERVKRLCDEEGIPVGIHDTATDSTTLGAQRPLTLTQLLEECAGTDMGYLAEHRTELGIHYRSRDTLYNQGVQFEIDAGLINPFEPVEDDERLTNDVTVTRTGGSFAREFSQVSIDKKGRAPDNPTVNTETDAQLPSQANWRLRRGTWPEMRIPTITVENAKDTSLVERWLGTTFGDVVQITDPPAEYATGTVSQLMEGYTETITNFTWGPTMNTSPADLLTVAVLESATQRLDTAGSQLQTGIDDNDTTLDVATTSGPLWTTDAGEFPFDATTGGEIYTVTDIDPALITFGAAGTAAHANNANVTPGIPASVAAGNLLLVFAAIRNSGTGIPDTPSGYVRLPVFDTTANAQLFAKIAVGGDTAPTISFTGGVANADTSAQMIRVAGKFHDADNLVVGSNTILNASAQDIYTPPLYIDTDNCLVLYLAWKQDDWTSVAAIAGATEIGEPDTTTGDDQGIVWDYVIQTTATNIAKASFVVTGGAAAISRSAVVALRCDRQTFTVTRSVNGIVKAHSAGAAVNVAHPIVLAL